MVTNVVADLEQKSGKIDSIILTGQPVNIQNKNYVGIGIGIGIILF